MTDTPTTPAKRPTRRVQGPPGVRCPSCNKIAGAADEGEVENYQPEVEGDAEQVTVSVTAELYLTTACCGDQFKMYALEGDYQIDHECETVARRDQAVADYNAHVEANACGCTADQADADCQTGTDLYDGRNALIERVDDDEADWEIEDEGDPEPYQRWQDTDPRTGRKIANPRYQRSYRGITMEVVVKHALCEETETLSFGGQHIEAGAGDFESLV